MSERAKVAKYVNGRQWMPKDDYEAAHVHIKRAQEKAVAGWGSADTSPQSAHRVAFHYHSHRKKHETEGLHGCGISAKTDKMEFAGLFNVDSEALFYYHGHNIVSVLRDKKDMPAPRVRFSLCSHNTKSTRDRLNRYAVDLGVKFYCWKHNHSAFALWVHDGTVFWGPICADDSIIATNR